MAKGGFGGKKSGGGGKGVGLAKTTGFSAKIGKGKRKFGKEMASPAKD